MLPEVDPGKLWEGCRSPIKGTRQSALNSLQCRERGWNTRLFPVCRVEQGALWEAQQLAC